MDDDANNVADDPTVDGHLPVSGEFDANNVPDESNPLTSAEGEDDIDASDTDDLEDNYGESPEPTSPETSGTPDEELPPEAQ